MINFTGNFKYGFHLTFAQHFYHFMGFHTNNILKKCHSLAVCSVDFAGFNTTLYNTLNIYVFMIIILKISTNQQIKMHKARKNKTQLLLLSSVGHCILEGCGSEYVTKTRKTVKSNWFLYCQWSQNSLWQLLLKS